MCELELRVERSYLFLAHYFSILVVCTPLARCTGEALGEICGYRSFSTSDCRATRESWLCFGHGGKFSFRRALSGIRCSSSPQGDGKAKLQNALIGQIARTMSYSTAFGNKTEGRRRRSLGCISSTLPHRATLEAQVLPMLAPTCCFNGGVILQLVSYVVLVDSSTPWIILLEA